MSTLVEDPIVRQQLLAVGLGDLAVPQHSNRIARDGAKGRAERVDLLGPFPCCGLRESNQGHDVVDLGGQRLQRGTYRDEEVLPEHEVVRWVAREDQLREDDEICPLVSRTRDRITHQRAVFLYGTHRRVYLRQRDSQGVGSTHHR